MTVCIAALSDSGGGCVLASDLMTTAHFPISYEFESGEVEKVIKIADSTYTLFSGDVLFANQVIENARTKSQIASVKNVGQVAEEIRKSYQDERKRRIIQNELEPRGLDLNSYYQSQQSLLQAIVQMIDQAFKQYNPGTEFLISGKDDSGCHIFTIGNPGLSICNDPIGFAAIGSGGPHAIYFLIGSGYKKSMSIEEVNKLVLKAKEQAEVAPGVGKGTKTVSI